MNFRFTHEQERFRLELREFIAREWGDQAVVTAEEDASDEGWQRQQHFRKRLAEEGWRIRPWPRQWGGQAASRLDQAIYSEEMALAGAPGLDQGVDRVGPTLMLFGNDQQQKRFLPAIAEANIFWCQGFSEPGAGSDLAGLQTIATDDGDHFLISGQKIWTSHAHRADWIFLLARTNQQAPKHRGLSFFLVDLRSPGVTVQPLLNMAGTHGFNQVFLDSVRVPRENLVGEQDRGWYIAATTLDFERSGINRVGGATHTLNQVTDYVREKGLGRRAAVRNQLAELQIEFDLGRLLAYRVAWLQSEGEVPNYESSMSKLFGSEMQQRLANFAVNTLGLLGQFTSEGRWTPLAGRIARYYLSSTALTIAAGTSEIQRNIIGTRGLGLPRG